MDNGLSNKRTLRADLSEITPEGLLYYCRGSWLEEIGGVSELARYKYYQNRFIDLESMSSGEVVDGRIISTGNISISDDINSAEIRGISCFLQELHGKLIPGLRIEFSDGYRCLYPGKTTQVLHELIIPEKALAVKCDNFASLTVLSTEPFDITSLPAPRLF